MNKTWTSVIFSAAAALFSAQAHAVPIVTFEAGSAPGYNPTNADSGMVISDQFAQSHGVTFSTVNGSSPMLAVPGVALPSGSCAYVSPCNGAPTGYQLFPGFYDSSDALIISFLAPVSSSTGNLIDIEGPERIYIDVLGANNQVLESATFAGPGNASVISWNFTHQTNDIHALRLSTNSTGWTIDNVSGVDVSAIPAPATLALLGLGLIGFCRRRG